jgi:hypothetical protein
VLAAIGRAAGADLAGAGVPVQAVAEVSGDGAWLLILDNLEQVIGVARDLGELLARCPQLVMLATSRTVLGLRGEREYPVPPLPLPAGRRHVSPGPPESPVVLGNGVLLDRSERGECGLRVALGQPQRRGRDADLPAVAVLLAQPGQELSGPLNLAQADSLQGSPGGKATTGSRRAGSFTCWTTSTPSAG